MLTVYKYTLVVQDEEQHYQLPQGAKIIHCDTQYERITFWALVETDRELEDAWFIVRGTGSPIPVNKEWGYIGSCLVAAGQLVWHIFKKK